METYCSVLTSHLRDVLSAFQTIIATTDMSIHDRLVQTTRFLDALKDLETRYQNAVEILPQYYKFRFFDIFCG